MPTQLRVTAWLSSAIAGGAHTLGPLDGPLSWAWFEREAAAGRQHPPITPTHAMDPELPLAKDVIGPDPDWWMWCTSDPIAEVVSESFTHAYRFPAITEMASYATSTRHNVADGPTKTRQITVPVSVVRLVSWDVMATDVDDLHDLLGYLTHLGGRTRNGYGRVEKWATTPAVRDHAWKRTLAPHPDGIEVHAIRAPYWHPARLHPCKRTHSA